ncbi:hypothetical protein [Sphingomonas sp. CFBP 8760]|uniref:hypothetical protein n=1 Tax=Sphingomonas sp. CFBP 8760 TaxID=2775282 RepID=UPI001785EA36|nr:hypothetical protein [Sphingomonas sp. CFBP 8760]MBD8548302.1 hypothetical protein [Sphingomonas sp. CFBP 8760]
MKESDKSNIEFIEVIKYYLNSNDSCIMNDFRNRIFIDTGAEHDIEIVVVVATANPGHIFGHVMFDPVLDQWRIFLLHSDADIHCKPDEDEMTAYRDMVVHHQNYSLVYSFEQARTSACADSFGEAIRAMCEIIAAFELSSAWPDQPGPGHQIDFAPFDAYGFLKRQLR